MSTDGRIKDHFVIVDAVGVTESDLMETKPLERKPGVSFQKLLNDVAIGHRDPDVISSIASRVARLETVASPTDREALSREGGVDLSQLVVQLVHSTDPDRQVEAAQSETGKDEPTEAEVQAAAAKLMDAALRPLTDNR